MALEDGKKRDFDLSLVIAGFRECRGPGNEIYLDGYITAFRELCRFFKLVGKLFYFVSRDLGHKIETLANHRKMEYGAEYETVQSMLEYEQKSGFVASPSNLRAGTECLLTLHRALEFILAFIKEIFVRPEGDPTSVIAGEIYDKTLAKHHIWIVRKMAGLAVLTLPSRRRLVEIMCKQNYDEVLVLAEQLQEQGQPVYHTIQKLYEKDDLLNIS